jgi:hypothetical protein
MKLTTMHQVFVSTTVVLAFVLFIRGIFLFATRSDAAALLLGGAGLVVGVVAVGYLRTFRAKLRQRTPQRPSESPSE